MADLRWVDNPNRWNNEPAYLHPDMRWIAEQLLAQARAAGLPLEIFETYRTQERQGRLNQTGASRATRTDGPHNRAVAADFVITTDYAETWGDKWRTGLDETRSIVLDEERWAIWQKWAEIVASFPQLTWGGDWQDDGPDGAELIDFDPYHVNLKNWRDYPPIPDMLGDPPPWLMVEPDGTPIVTKKTAGLITAAILIGGGIVLKEFLK